MDDSKLTELMEGHGVKVTANRLIVARALHASLMPMSLPELERRIVTLDKSSIFRVLSLFRENHLVHVIEDGGGGVKYELCHSHSSLADEDAHAHFHCEVCTCGQLSGQGGVSGVQAPALTVSRTTRGELLPLS